MIVRVPNADAPRSGEELGAGARAIADNLEYLADTLMRPGLRFHDTAAIASELSRQADRIRKAVNP